MSHLNRRKFVKLAGSGVLFLSVPYPAILTAAEKAIYKSKDFYSHASNTDKILQLAAEIQSEIDQVSQEVIYTSNFCKNLYSHTEAYGSLYQGGAYFCSLRNKLYSSFINICATDFDSEIIIFSRFIIKSLSQSLTRGLFEINSSSGVTKIVPDLDKATFAYKNDVIDNLLDISMPVKFVSPGGSTVDKILRLAVNLYNSSSGSIKCDLINYPAFFENDGSKADPVDSLPVNSRSEFRTTMISTLRNSLDKMNVAVSAPQVDSVNYRFALKNVVLYNGLRLLSNSSATFQKSAFSNEHLPNYILSGNSGALFINPRYSLQLLSALLASKVKLDIPPEFNYSITVNSIEQYGQTTANFRIFFNGSYSYNWVVDDATVSVNIDSHYLVTFIKYLQQTTLVARQASYEAKIEASGFPPFGIGPKSPDDAVSDTKALVTNAMQEDALVRFSLPTPDTEIRFSNGGLMILINSL